MRSSPIYKIALCAIIFLAISCKQNGTGVAIKSAPISVRAVEVQQKDIKEYLTFNGVTQYQKKDNIRSSVTGYISSLNFTVGDQIRSGQTFASVRTKEQEALREAIKIDSSLAKFTMPIVIKSNATGILMALSAVRNSYVAEGDVLATVVLPNSLVVQVNVPYENEDYVRTGTSCDIILQNNDTIAAAISAILPTIDPVAQSQAFLIALPNTSLPENLNVQVRIVYREAANALCIPKTALQTNELLTQFWVLKVVDDTLALKQNVTPLLHNESLVQIEPGTLKLHDKIITEGGYQMQDSTVIRIQQE
jgi:multidrug efflux pump subunit AcrA (membrane-fusion protein)